MKNRLLNLLQEGERNSLSRQHLAITLGISDRKVRMLIHELRLEGNHICSNCECSGYFMAANEQDLRKCQNQFKARAEKEMEVYYALGGK